MTLREFFSEENKAQPGTVIRLSNGHVWMVTPDREWSCGWGSCSATSLIPDNDWGSGLGYHYSRLVEEDWDVDEIEVTVLGRATSWEEFFALYQKAIDEDYDEVRFNG